MSSSQFRVWLNNEFLPSHPKYSWIKEAYSKSVTQAVNNGQTAFEKFFNHKSAFPKFKKKGRSDVKMYFLRNNPKDCLCERHRIKIPSLGWIRIKEKGYIPTTKDGYVFKSGHVSIKADRLRKLEKKLIREQRSLSRKYENIKKGGSTQKRNIQKQRLKIQKLHHRIDNIRTDHINKIIAEIVKTKPSYITIEDLNVSGMMKNRHLSKTVASQKFYEFRSKLLAKCRENGIEQRTVDRWFPSSKTCHCCKSIKKDLKLSDRIFRCDCGYIEDRDFNAATNLRDAMTYEVA
ncbi:RNA-guided endonuclease InsQ/TnpB family protein [Catenibacterium mitsuokai]|uniref:RNA-guided endonuclease InsQ/TnpB family protein n=1 Tax=Catenibacterium mitsuokai TaxID=100886 RepID=UPI003F8916C8